MTFASKTVIAYVTYNVMVNGQATASLLVQLSSASTRLGEPNLHDRLQVVCFPQVEDRPERILYVAVLPLSLPSDDLASVLDQMIPGSFQIIHEEFQDRCPVFVLHYVEMGIIVAEFDSGTGITGDRHLEYIGIEPAC